MRLFIAVQFSDKILNELSRIQKYWQSLGMKGHYVSSENLHMTIAFIGEYKDPHYVLETLETVSFSPFTVELDGIGNFGDLYWVGTRRNEEMEATVKRVRRILAINNIQYDRKRFSPHITLVRKAIFDGKTEKLTGVLPKGTEEIDSLYLMSSTRGKNGMIYEVVGNVNAKR